MASEVTATVGEPSPVIPLGTQTPFGRVAAVGWVGERYYWCVEDDGAVSMIPGSVLVTVPGEE